MTGYEAFSIFHVLKLHFTTDYDYFKYNGKCNITIETFEKRKDKYHFYKLSRKYDEENYKQFVISNLLKDTNIWAGNLLEDCAKEYHIKRMATLQSLSYHFKNDCQKIKDITDFNSSLKTEGDYPILLRMAVQGDISDESVCILNCLVNFLPMWHRKIKDTIRWPIVYSKWVCYTPFLSFDKSKFKKMALEGLQ